MKDRKRLYNKAKRKQTPKTWEAYWKIRNKVTQAIENAHGDYQQQLFDTKSNTVSKKFYKNDHTGVASLKVNGFTIQGQRILNNQFFSVFTEENISYIPQASDSFPIMPNISFNVEGIYNLLNGLHINKSPGHDS